MVRTAIACGWCRRSKIKCIHQGNPPCRNCLKNGRTLENDCILSGPDLRSIKKKRNISHHDLGQERCRSPLINGVEGSQYSQRAPSAVDTNITVDDIVRSTSRAEILQAASNFRLKFPELSFLHIGKFDAEADGTADVLFIGSILALCATTGRREEYVSYVKKGLSAAQDSPTLTTVQSLLVISMHDWGHGKGYSAWMKTGTAIRMMQALDTIFKPKKFDFVEQEIYNRTFWSCFIMDRLVCCGNSQPFVLPFDQMAIHLPIGDQDFAFGQLSASRVHVSHIDKSTHSTIDHSYSLLVRGFDIWARVLNWVVNGGRRQPGMHYLANCPWTPGSPWKGFYDELQVWRNMQQPRLKYPEVQAAGHVSLAHGEQFAYINLIYYVSILFLGREYIPFLPTPESEPQGPVDPPLLEAVAPEGWWSQRADQLFDAAVQITKLLQELDVLETPLLTPFPGFCAFSAATMNAYVTHFPRMNYGNGISTAAESLKINVQWLSRFKEIWPMGHGWSKTILYSSKLYSKANQDRRRYQGKTRADFEALEASIHNSSGDFAVPEDENQIRESDPHDNNDTTGHETEAALGLQQLSDPNGNFQYPSYTFDGMFPDDTSNFNQWNQMLPLWGEQQSDLLSDGFNYDFELGVVDL